MGKVEDIWDLGRTTIKVSALWKCLQLYPLEDVALELGWGFQTGFRIPYVGPRLRTISQNLLSAVHQADEVQKKISKEIEMGRISGPYKHIPISNMRISPIGVVPKSTEGWRLITHLSYPQANSVNDFLDPQACSVQYTSFDKVVEMVAKQGVNAKLAKIDIKSAFRLLPIYPGDFDLLGFQFKGQYYIDKCLPMGCSISCSLFEKFATFLHWLVAHNTNKRTLDHYLDDFIFVGPSYSQDCEILMHAFFQVCKDLGVPIAEEKTCGPTTSLIFLGLVIDTHDLTVKIPIEKVRQLQALLLNCLRKKKVTLKEIQALVGALNFFSRAVPSARAFNRRFYDATCGVKQPHHFIRINAGIREDLEMWLTFLRDFNGKRYFQICSWHHSDVLQLFTDSAGKSQLGCGAFFNGQWFFFPWPVHWHGCPIMRDITLLELIPVVLAISTWGSQFSNKKLIMHVDNEALVSVINKQTSKSKNVMTLVRTLVLCLLQNNTTFRSEHVPGSSNKIADSISRKQWSRFRTLAPEADEFPTKIPTPFAEMIFNLKLTDCWGHQQLRALRKHMIGV